MWPKAGKNRLPHLVVLGMSLVSCMAYLLKMYNILNKILKTSKRSKGSSSWNYYSNHIFYDIYLGLTMEVPFVVVRTMTFGLKRNILNQSLNFCKPLKGWAFYQTKEAGGGPFSPPPPVSRLIVMWRGWFFQGPNIL